MPIAARPFILRGVLPPNKITLNFVRLTPRFGTDETLPCAALHRKIRENIFAFPYFTDAALRSDENAAVFLVYNCVLGSPQGILAATASATARSFFLAHRYRSAPAVRFGIDENAAVFLVYNCVLGSPQGTLAATAYRFARSEERSSILKNTAHFLRILRLLLRQFPAKRGRARQTTSRGIFNLSSCTHTQLAAEFAALAARFSDDKTRFSERA